MARLIDVRTDAEKDAARSLVPGSADLGHDARYCPACGAWDTFAKHPGTMRCSRCRTEWTVPLSVTMAASLRDGYLQSIAKKLAP